MKKNLIIVESLTNLFIAIKIRNMYRDERFDLVLPSNRESLYSIYLSGRLNNVFDNVFSANYDEINSILKKLAVIIDIRLAVYQYLGKDFSDEYTDLFFWNPSNFLFVMYAFLNRNSTISVHVYSDAFGGYIVDSPDSPLNEYDEFGNLNYPHFKNGLWDRLFKIKYQTPYVRNMVFDYYMFKPELSVIERTHSIVEVPAFDNASIDLINFVYDYDKDYSVAHKWIILSNVIGERRKSEEELKTLRNIIDELPRETVAIKPHPRCDVECFAGLGVDILFSTYPLELLILNNQIEDCVFFSDESSAILFSALVLNKRITVIWLRGLFDGYKVYSDDLWRFYVDKMKEMGCCCYEPKDIDEIKSIIESIKIDKSKSIKG